MTSKKWYFFIGLGLLALGFMLGLMFGYSFVAPKQQEDKECMEYVTYETQDGKVIETKIPERNKNCEK